MNIIKSILHGLSGKINLDELSQLNPDRITIKDISKLLYISERFSHTICEAAVRQGQFVRHTTCGDINCYDTDHVFYSLVDENEDV
jgi:hypothetical protein